MIAKAQDAMNEINDILITIERNIAILDATLTNLEEEGIFDTIPTMAWEQRNGGTTSYLRLVFPTQGRKRRKQYVGAKPAKIAAAKAQITRTEDHSTLTARRSTLTRQLDHAHSSLRVLVTRMLPYADHP